MSTTGATTPADKPLSTNQRRFLVAMAEHRTIEAAAEAAGTSKTSAYTWLRQPNFQAALRELEHRTIDEAARQLLTLTGKATKALEDILDDRLAKQTDLNRAARTVLELALRLRESVVLEERIAELERRLGVNEA